MLNNLCSTGNTEYSYGRWDTCPLGEPLLSSSWLLPWWNLSQYIRVPECLKKNWKSGGFMWDLPNFKIDTNIFKTPHGWNKFSLPVECGPVACVISLLGLASLSYSNAWICRDWDSPSPRVGLGGTPSSEPVFWAQWVVGQSKHWGWHLERRLSPKGEAVAPAALEQERHMSQRRIQGMSGVQPVTDGRGGNVRADSGQRVCAVGRR